MSSSSVQIEMGDSTVGVTTRSRKRLRDEADASSPSGDLHDRKRSRLQPPSVPLRRSPRRAAIAASKADLQIISARHPESGSETPSTSRSSSLVEAESDPAQASTSSLTANHTSDVTSSDRRVTPSAHPVPTLRVPQEVDLIDPTDPSIALKRKRSAIEDDDTDAEVQVTPDDTLDTRTSKKARVDISDNATFRGAPSVSPSRLSHRRNRKLVKDDVSMATNEISSSMQSPLESFSEASANEVHTAEEDPQDFEVDSSLRAHELAQEMSGEMVLSGSITNADDKPETSSEDSGSELILPLYLPPQSFLVTDNSSAPSSQDDPQQCEEAPQPQPTPTGEVLDQASSQDGAQRVVLEEVSLSQPSPANGIVSQPFAQEDAPRFATPCGQLDLAEGIEIPSPQDDSKQNRVISMVGPGFETGDDITADPAGSAVLTTAPSSSADQVEKHPHSPTSPNYSGVDAKLAYARRAPSSYLAPSPDRRMREAHPQKGRFDKAVSLFLTFATENAGKVTYNKTGRQFPVWMTRPTRIYFDGEQFIRGGRPATAKDLISEEIGVGMHIDDSLASPSVPDELLSQGQLFPSDSTCTAPQIPLDPELDPSSLVDGQSSFDTQGTPMDFLGAEPGPVPTSSQFASFPDGQLEDHFHLPQQQFHPSQQQFHPPQGSFHPPQGSFHPPQGPFHPPSEQFHDFPQQFHPPPQQFHPSPEQFHSPPQQFHPPPEQFHPSPEQFHSPPQQFHPPPEQFHPPPEQFYQFPQQFHQPVEQLPVEQFQAVEQRRTVEQFHQELLYQSADQFHRESVEQPFEHHELLQPLPQETSSQTQEQYVSESPLTGPSNGSASAFQASDSDVPAGHTVSDLQELLSSDSSQCPLFGFVPLIPAKNLSLESSLAAMATYFANDTSSLQSDLDTSNIVDVTPQVAHTPNIRQVDDSDDTE